MTTAKYDKLQGLQPVDGARLKMTLAKYDKLQGLQPDDGTMLKITPAKYSKLQGLQPVDGARLKMWPSTRIGTLRSRAVRSRAVPGQQLGVREP